MRQASNNSMGVCGNRLESAANATHLRVPCCCLVAGNWQAQLPAHHFSWQSGTFVAFRYCAASSADLLHRQGALPSIQ